MITTEQVCKIKARLLKEMPPVDTAVGIVGSSLIITMGQIPLFFGEPTQQAFYDTHPDRKHSLYQNLLFTSPEDIARALNNGVFYLGRQAGEYKMRGAKKTAKDWRELI